MDLQPQIAQEPAVAPCARVAIASPTVPSVWVGQHRNAMMFLTPGFGYFTCQPMNKNRFACDRLRSGGAHAAVQLSHCSHLSRGGLSQEHFLFCIPTMLVILPSERRIPLALLSPGDELCCTSVCKQWECSERHWLCLEHRLYNGPGRRQTNR